MPMVYASNFQPLEIDLDQSFRRSPQFPRGRSAALQVAQNTTRPSSSTPLPASTSSSERTASIQRAATTPAPVRKTSSIANYLPNVVRNAGSSLYNKAFDYFAPKMAKAFDDRTGTNIGSNFLHGNALNGISEIGRYAANAGRNYLRNGLDAILPKHVGSGYGIAPNPAAGVVGTQRFADGIMDTPIQYIGSDAGRVLGRWAANELPLGDFAHRVAPFAEWAGSKVGQGLGWLGQKALNHFMPHGYAEMTPNELSHRIGDRFGSHMFNMMPHHYQNVAGFQQLPFAGDYARGGYAHGGYIPTLRELAEMMSN